MLDRHLNSQRLLFHRKRSPACLYQNGSVIVLHHADVLFSHFGFQADRNPESSSFLGLPSYVTGRMGLGHRLQESFPILTTRLAVVTETLTVPKNKQTNKQKPSKINQNEPLGYDVWKKKAEEAAWPFQPRGSLVQGVSGSKHKVTEIRMPRVTSASASVAVGAA